jgi:hypothetical protein
LNIPWSLNLGISSFRLQADGMPRIEATRRSVSRIPARRPFAPIAIVRRGVEPDPGNDCKSVTLARVDRDPFASAGLAVAAKLGRTHWRADQASCAEHVGDCAGTIVSVIIKRFVAAAEPVPFVAKLIGRPDGAFHRERRTLWRSRAAKMKPGDFARSDRPFCRKKIGRRGRKDQS